MKVFFKVIKNLILLALLVVLIFIMLFVIKNFDRLTKRYGVINKNGETVIDFKYGVVALPDNGDMQTEYYLVSLIDYFGRYVKMQYLDLDGKVCFDSTDNNIFPSFYYNRSAAHSSDNDKEGFINIHGKKFHDFIYDSVDDYDKGYAVVYKYDEEKEDYLAGLIDLDENVVLEFIYDDISVLSNSFFKVYIGDDLYVANKRGEIITEKIENKKVTFINYRDISKLGAIDTKNVSYYEDFIIVRDETAESYYDSNGVLLHKFENCSVHGPIDTRYFVIRTDENPDGYVVDIIDGFRQVYSSDKYTVWNVIGGKVIAKDKATEKFGLVDFNDNIIIPFEYDSLGAVKRDPSHVLPAVGNKYGLIDLDGNVLIEPTSEYKLLLLGDGNTYITCKTIPTLLVAYIAIIGLCALYTLFMIVRLIKFIKKLRLKRKEKKEQKEEVQTEEKNES